MCVWKVIWNREMLSLYAQHLMAVLILVMLSGSGSAEAAVLTYQLPYMEDFEAPLTPGTPIHEVGAWSSDLLNGSAVVSASYSFSETTRPIDPSADAQILQLAMGSSGVTNSFDGPDADQVVYLDSMLKLTPRLSIPASATNDPSVQLFFFLNADTNIVVYHGGMDGNGPLMTVLPVNPLVSNDWNRFTVTLDYVHGDDEYIDRKYFKIQLNGMDLTSAQAYSMPGQTGSYDGGAWFFTADQTGPDSVGSVVFEGSGGVDDLVVTTRAPSFSAAPVFHITSELLGMGSTLPSGEISVVGGSSTQIVYQAAPWYEISGFEQNGSSVPAAIGEQTYTAVLANVQGHVTNRVEFSETMAAVDGKTPASWYGPLGADPTRFDEDSDGLSLFEEYLLNTDPRGFNVFSLFQYGSAALGWDSLDFPNGQVVPEVSTNLIEGGWWPLGGYLTWESDATIWNFPEDMPDEPFFIRMNVVE